MTDGQDSHDGTAAQHAAGPEERLLRYPPSPWALEFFCLALMGVVLAVYYGPTGPLVALPFVLLLLACDLGFLSRRFCGPLGILGRFGRHKGFAFRSDGVTINGIFVPWGGLLWVAGPRLRSTAVLGLHTEVPRGSLRGRRRRRGRLGEADAAAGVTFSVVGWPFFYRDVLPEMLRRQPDLTLAPAVRDALEDPERPDRARFWLGLVGLCVLVVGLTALLLTGWVVPPGDYRTLSGLPGVGRLPGASAGPLSTPAMAAVFLIGWATLLRPRTPADALGMAAGFAGMMVAFIAGFQSAPRSVLSLRMVTLTALGISTAGLAVWVTGVRLRRAAQVVLAAAILAAPVGYRMQARAMRWPGARRLPVTEEQWESWSRGRLWSLSGRHILLETGCRARLPGCRVEADPGGLRHGCARYADDRTVVCEADGWHRGAPCAIQVWDVVAGRRHDVPMRGAVDARPPAPASAHQRPFPELAPARRHEAEAVRWPGYGVEEDSRWLTVGSVAPLCPRRERLSYLEVDGTTGHAELHVWSLATGAPECPPVQLPPDLCDGDAEALWTGDDEVTVVGSGAREDGTGPCTHVLRVEVGGGVRERSVLQGHKDEWTLAPGAGHALASCGEWVPSADFTVLVPRYATRLGDVEAGTETSLAGSGTPAVLAVRAGCAFRSVAGPRGTVLMRIDYERAVEEPLRRVPGGWHLASVSPSGAVALFARTSANRRTLWALMRVADGDWHLLDYPVSDYASQYAPEVSGYGGETPFSPDERFILVPVGRPHPKELLLVPVPEDWRSGAGEDG